MRMHRPRFVVQRLVMPPHASCFYRCPKRLYDGIIAVELLDTMGIVLRLREKLRCLNRRFMVILPTMA